MKVKIPRNPCNTRSSIITFQNFFPDFNPMLSAVPVTQECMNKERTESLKPILKASIWWISSEEKSSEGEWLVLYLMSHQLYCCLISTSQFFRLMFSCSSTPFAFKHLVGVHWLTLIITDLQQINFHVLIPRNIFSLYHAKCVQSILSDLQLYNKAVTAHQST
jgi:hypothetical protein